MYDDEYLAHSGVLGMKWGVRKDGLPQGTLGSGPNKTNSSKPKSALNPIYRSKANKNYRSVRSDQKSYRRETNLGKAITKEEYQKFKRKDTTFEKGHTLRRVTMNPEAAYNTERMYVSTNKKDASRYRAVLTEGALLPWKEVEYKTTTKLRSPSEKTRFDEFTKLLGSTIDMPDGSKLTGREFLTKNGLGKEVATATNYQMGLLYYNSFTRSQGAQTPFNSAYFNQLSKKGYNSFIDDNDRNIISDQPLVLLNPDASIKKMSVKKISYNDVYDARSTYDAPNSVKPKNK